MKSSAMVLMLGLITFSSFAADPWVEYKGGDGPGKGKHIVFVTGDDEYRSEESMPQMAKILSQRHGFDCTVLFAINKETGAIDPATMDNIPGLEKLADADLMIVFLRFRALPDEQMKMFMDYTNSGKPIIGLRTATHAFNFPADGDSGYKQWTWTSKEPRGGWGRAVLGETWVSHYGHHEKEATRGVVAKGFEGHPLVNGCEDIFGLSDVYEVRKMRDDVQPVILGKVLQGMKPDDPQNTDKEELPISWIAEYTGESGKTARVYTTTMGHSYDFKSEGVRRMMVNGVYWALGMEDEIPERANVDYVGAYDPTYIGFGTHKVGVMPADHAL